MNSSSKIASKPVVLVVDDNRDAAITLGMLLKLKGYQTYTCFSGHEALAAVDEYAPDVVLLDLAMPGMDGYETARQLRERSANAPVLIALSGYNQDEDEGSSIRAGFNEHLVKPADLDKLTGLLDRLQS